MALPKVSKTNTQSGFNVGVLFYFNFNQNHKTPNRYSGMSKCHFSLFLKSQFIAFSTSNYRVKK